MNKHEIETKVKELLSENERLEKEYDKNVEENEKELRDYFNPLVLKYKKYVLKKYSGGICLGYEFYDSYLGDNSCSDYDWDINYDELTRENLDGMKILYLEQEKINEEQDNKEERKLYEELKEKYEGK